MPKNSVIKIIIFISCLSYIFAVPCFAAPENLDEMELRKARKNVNIFYSGESKTNAYLWQPMTLCYTDITSGHEVWVMTNTDNATAYSGSEYGHQPWSADGKWFSLAIDKDTDAFTRGSYYADEVWYTVQADGSGMRPRTDAPARIRTHSAYTQWSPVEPDVYYEFGRRYAGETGFDYNMLYRVTLTDSGVTTEPWIDFIPGNTGTERDLPKDALSADGKYTLATQYTEQGTVAIGDMTSRKLKLSEYNMDRGVDTYWYDFPAGQADWHDEMFVGADGNYWIYYLFTTGSWARMRPWGTDGSAPNHTADRTSPYVWWEGAEDQKEIQPVNGKVGTKAFTNNYWSHGVPDRWGNHFAYSDTDDAYVAPGVSNVDLDKRTAFPSSVRGAQYHAWTGWTDYSTGTDGSDQIYIMKYDDGSTHAEIASIHASTGDQFTKPGQSPDGTKTAYRSDFLQPTSTNGDVFYVVTRYPYPPEIFQTSLAAGIVTIQFDWGLDQTSPRGYTSRGWPNESMDNPPAPRETKEFRLWRSSNGTTGWEPIKTIAANPFDKFDYINGGLKAGQVAYWEFTDIPGDGNWFYAVTSIEHSGLESRSLSNVVSSTGSQTAAYPSDPGGISSFYSKLPLSPVLTAEATATPGHYQLSWAEPQTPLVRYYNIYYSTDNLPAVDQRNRIASLPKGTSTYLDWLADPIKPGYYRITSVDFQGNEGEVSDISLTPPTAPSNFKLIVLN